MAAPDDTADLTIAGAVALLAALGIAGAGAVAMSSRRRRRDADVTLEPVSAAPAPLEPAPLVHQDSVMPEGMVPLATAPKAQIADDAPGSRVHGGGLAPSHDGPVPTDPEERRALIERMVAAPPDADNPFTTAKGRRRRARLLLNRREKEMEQEKPFDWRAYKPSPARTEPAARDYVDA